MLIDNTMFGMYLRCPKLYFERYEVDNSDVQKSGDRQGPLQIQETTTGTGSGAEALLVEMGRDRQSPEPGLVQSERQGLHPPASRGIEPDEPSPGRDFGTRMHQLLHERRLDRLGFRRLGLRDQPSGGQYAPSPEWPEEGIEAEAQSTLAAYEAHYIRDYDYLESERTHTLDLPERCPSCWQLGEYISDGDFWCGQCARLYRRHQLAVKLDAVVRHGDGTIGPFDTKTESKPGYNTREDWAGRTQTKIYLYALEALYPHEKVSRAVIDVVTRGQTKAGRPALFYRHDDITGTPDRIEEVIRNVVWVCDDIERSRSNNWWRSNENMCKRGWEKCDYFDLHQIGRSSETLKKYRPADQYLDL